MLREICLDTETTGLYPKNGDRIIEIGCVELTRHGIGKNRFHQYINPERTMSSDVIKTHHIEDSMLINQPKFAEIADRFVEFVKGARLIIHNAAFDVSFFDEEFRRLGRPPLKEVCAEIVDSMDIARATFPQMHNSLDALCKRLGIDTTVREEEGHGALLDAELLAQVYLALRQSQVAIDIGAAVVEPIVPVVKTQIEGDLLVIKANEQELQEHEKVLAMVDKACKGKSLYEMTPEELSLAAKAEQEALKKKENEDKAFLDSL